MEPLKRSLPSQAPNERLPGTDEPWPTGHPHRIRRGFGWQKRLAALGVIVPDHIDAPLPSVIVDQVDVNDLVVLETKHDTPIARHTHAPHANRLRLIPGRLNAAADLRDLSLPGLAARGESPTAFDPR